MKTYTIGEMLAWSYKFFASDSYTISVYPMYTLWKSFAPNPALHFGHFRCRVSYLSFQGSKVNITLIINKKKKNYIGRKYDRYENLPRLQTFHAEYVETLRQDCVFSINFARGTCQNILQIEKIENTSNQFWTRTDEYWLFSELCFWWGEGGDASIFIRNHMRS